MEQTIVNFEHYLKSLLDLELRLQLEHAKFYVTIYWLLWLATTTTVILLQESSSTNARHAQTANEFFRDFKKNFWSNFLKRNLGTSFTYVAMYSDNLLKLYRPGHPNANFSNVWIGVPRSEIHRDFGNNFSSDGNNFYKSRYGHAMYILQ